MKDFQQVIDEVFLALWGQSLVNRLEQYQTNIMACGGNIHVLQFHEHGAEGEGRKWFSAAIMMNLPLPSTDTE